jgi:hypothetical protein
MAKPTGKSQKTDMPSDTPSNPPSPVVADASPVSPLSSSEPTASDAGTRSESSVRNEGSSKPDGNASSSIAKKEVPKVKKPLPMKNSSLLPSQQKLDHLKAAVLAAGNADNLITILHHVDEAGGRKEVLESIEAYRVLKTVLEES